MTQGSLFQQQFGGDWTEEKLSILKKYLDAYNKVLKDKPFKDNPFKRVYIDAFAGTGYRQDPRSTELDLFAEFNEDNSEEFLKGSAALALESKPGFHQYYFIESNFAKVAELEKLKGSHPNKTVTIEQGDANKFIKKYCDSEDWRGTRAVLFLDPFATEVEWSTIEAVARTHSIDVWILFPLMAVNRLLAKVPRKEFFVRLNRVYGTSDWFEHFYKRTTLDDIFGKDITEIKKACDFESIGAFYRSRLQTIFAGVAEKTKIFYNSRKSPLFQFFFAAGNLKGAVTAKKIANDLLKDI